MKGNKGDILAQLQSEIRSLQGKRAAAGGSLTNVSLGGIERHFPGGHFPVCGLHEFICPGAESASSSSGFIAGILSSLMKREGVAIWVGPTRGLFPPSLKAFGIPPHHVIFINARGESDLLWSVEEALKCSGLAAVVGNMKALSFNASRRLQLAVEGSGVPGFILRAGPDNGATACVSRWQITPAASGHGSGLPGLGFPRWNVSLLKVRHGTPASWQMEWAEGKFRAVHKEAIVMPRILRKKIG